MIYKYPYEAKNIETTRADKPFKNIADVKLRSGLSDASVEHLASADAFREIAGDRYTARWHAAAINPVNDLFDDAEEHDELVMPTPSLEQNVLDDYRSIGLTLRQHPMALLRNQYPFNKCKRFIDLASMRHKSFVRVAGIVTGKQRPGTASGVMFISLEDETGTINIVVWTRIQEHFRNEILTGSLLLITGTVEILTENVATPIVHVIAGNIRDHSSKLQDLELRPRSFR